MSALSMTATARRLAAGSLAVLVAATTGAVAAPAAATTTTTTTTTTVLPPLVVKPSADNTGVPAGTVLKPHYGDLVIKTAGTVINGLDVHGFIDVRAANVTIRNSLVRGGTATYNRGVITNYGYDNLLVQDVDIKPAYETVWQDGVKGSDFTLNRVHVTGNVDSVKVHGEGNVLIQNSLLENTVYYASDPNQGGKPTHNDGVQIINGSNIRLLNNTIRGQQGMPVLGAANKGNTSVVVKGNWLDGGHCTVKVEEKNGYQVDAVLAENKFGPNRAYSKCMINATTGSTVTSTNNTMELTGTLVNIIWTAS